MRFAVWMVLDGGDAEFIRFVEAPNEHRAVMAANEGFEGKAISARTSYDLRLLARRLDTETMDVEVK